MEKRVAELIAHPELMNRDTLESLKGMLHQYPYYQTVRLLYLRNLYLLRDESFDTELKKAALYIADRRVLFYVTEGYNYIIEPEHQKPSREPSEGEHSRTISLINRFLTTQTEEKEAEKKTTPADITNDYAAYLLQMDDIDTPEALEQGSLKGQNLIDNFIDRKPERLVLPDDTDYLPEIKTETENEEDYFTETLARIYIKQGRYAKAIEIIHKLSLNYPKKNSYFADQIRFLEKLIINNKNKK